MKNAKTILRVPANRIDETGMTLEKFSNIIARQHGYGSCTAIRRGRGSAVVASINFGYRKITTDEYVNRTYQRLCYGKGIYYQESVFSIQLDYRIYNRLTK